jgi:hypothetical protein
MNVLLRNTCFLLFSTLTAGVNAHQVIVINNDHHSLNNNRINSHRVVVPQFSTRTYGPVVSFSGTNYYQRNQNRFIRNSRNYYNQNVINNRVNHNSVYLNKRSPGHYGTSSFRTRTIYNSRNHSYRSLRNIRNGGRSVIYLNH